MGTQPIEHLHCLSRELNFPSDGKPTISYWLFQTLTGLTGITLFTIVSAMFIFSHPMVRKKAYNYFWCIHQLYVLLYIFSLLHGLARKAYYQLLSNNH